MLYRIPYCAKTFKMDTPFPFKKATRFASSFQKVSPKFSINHTVLNGWSVISVNPKVPLPVVSCCEPMKPRTWLTKTNKLVEVPEGMVSIKFKQCDNVATLSVRG